MKCAVVRDYPSPRFTDVEDAKEYTNENGGEICHLIRYSTGLQCTFGFGIVKDGELLGSKDYNVLRWSK